MKRAYPMFMLTNTLSEKKEKFISYDPKKVSLYACGITPYAPSHIGHGRSYVSFDVLYRWLQFLGYEVTYARNYTDIDDKLLRVAEKEFGDQHRYRECAERFIKQYQDEMAALNCKSPDHEPKVTEHIPQIITFIEKLIALGYAYQVDGDVYFEIAKFPEYGKLSKQKIQDLKAGSRVDVDTRKKDPLDFALWKSEPEGTFWNSPWGWGRPGWHIECSALANEYLGAQIDIHGGGRDLIFPHHENEVAQSEAHHQKPFARYWVHNGLIRMGTEKMSKSLGNTLSLEDLCREYDPMGLRYYFLQHHYHSPLEFSFEDLVGARKSYKRLCAFFDSIATGSFTLEQMQAMPIVNKMIDYLMYDLNTAGAIGVLFENIDALAQNQTQAQAAKQLLQQVLGLRLIPIVEKTVEITPEIQDLLDRRAQARADKDWKRSDEIRDKLEALGVDVQDKKIS